MHSKYNLIVVLLLCGLEFFTVFGDETPTPVVEGVDDNSIPEEIDEVKMMDPFVYMPVRPEDMPTFPKHLDELIKNPPQIIANAPVRPEDMPTFPELLDKLSKDQPQISMGLNSPIKNSPLTMIATIRDSLDEYRKTLQGSRLPYDCDEAVRETRKSGVYQMELKDSDIGPFYAYCYMSISSNWLVIQQRIDGKIKFDRDWLNYKRGFGDLNGEHWLGLDLIHAITASRPHEIWINMHDQEGYLKDSFYNYFLVGDEESKYALQAVGVFDGTAGNSLDLNEGHEFSTKDNDNDSKKNGNCAQLTQSGWWFADCGGSNLNGIYRDTNAETTQGIQWNSWHGEKYSLKYVRMAIRPLQ